MLTYFQAIIFGLIQGITELFPISSLGHSVLLPKVLGWHIKQEDPFFLTFLVATHSATALVLFLFFLKDWQRIFTGLLRSIKEREIKASNHDGRLAWLLIIGTIPGGLLGLIFEQHLKNLFASPEIVAYVLILNGLFLIGAEKLWSKNFAVKTQRGSDTRIAKLSFPQAVKVGLFQCLALIPGFSRTGASLAGGLYVGLTHEDAARFSFLLATPIIAAALVLKLPGLFLPMLRPFLGPIIAGALAAGIAAYLSVRFLTKYFETKKLFPFGIYCIVVGGLVLAIFSLQ